MRSEGRWLDKLVEKADELSGDRGGRSACCTWVHDLERCFGRLKHVSIGRAERQSQKVLSATDLIYRNHARN
jgi:hypothetical protein